MQLATADWIVIAAYGLLALVVGVIFARRAGRGTEEYFLSGRQLPWWLLGTSMVATTFSTDTPNLVTDIVRQNGVAGNWVWWAFVVTGFCTVFFYARLWRRSGVLTDVGFYELRYSGRPAAFLRGFRAIYLGVFFNVMIMASVTLAAIKIAGVLLGLDKYTTVLAAGTVTVLYSATSGLWGVVVTDLLLFIISMTGAIAAAYFALAHPDVGGLAGLVSHPDVTSRLSFFPDFSNSSSVIALLVVPLAIQWWSTWYPGAEPGGGGYVAQRMLAARNEADAMKSTLWFNVAHYALRPWPWIIVALASVIVYPTLESITSRFPGVDQTVLGHDLAYPAMLVLVPHGLLGLVVASLAAAYMSTISTHLNWGASYIVDDVYRRFLAPNRDERHYVAIARIATVVLIAMAAALSLWLDNALQAFQILLQIGAGTGSIFLLRWFWWRVNAWSELSGMIISFIVAFYFEIVHVKLGLTPIDPSVRLLLGVAITTVGWITVTLLTRPANPATLQAFYDKITPIEKGWKTGVDTSRGGEQMDVRAAVVAWFLAVVAVLSALFTTGYFLYGRLLMGGVCLLILAVAIGGLFRVFPRVGLR